MAKRRILESERTEWSALAQIHVLAALMEVRAWNAQEIAFHGGTSLHMSWHSPRFSEDLDFLVAAEVSEDLPQIMARVEKRAREKFFAIDPKFHIEVKNKSSKLDRMGNFQVIVTHDDVLERAMVKAEFWSVDAAYLAKYPVEFRQPVVAGDIVARTSVLVPAGTLTSSIADKITALAGRPHLKWRDLFDIWWVTTQTRGLPSAAPGEGPGRLIPAPIIDQYLHNRTGYGERGSGVMKDVRALEAFLQMDDVRLVKQADADLRPFLPKSYWDQLGKAGVEQIVHHAKEVVRDVLASLSEMEGQIPVPSEYPPGVPDRDEEPDQVEPLAVERRGG